MTTVRVVAPARLHMGMLDASGDGARRFGGLGVAVDRPAVVNLTDDILLFTEAALGDPHPPTRPAAAVDGAVLADACSWREVAVDAIDAAGPRARVTTRVVGRGAGREFIGWSRAAHAVLEASILASRVRRLPADEIRAELARLTVVLDKTAGPRERAAMDLVLAHVRAAAGDG